MAKTKREMQDTSDEAKRDLQEVLNEATAAVRKTDFELFLRYSVEHDGWQARLGSGDQR